MPIIDIEPLTSPPVALDKNPLSTYCFGTAWKADTGSCPKVRMAPEESVIDDPDARVICAPDDRAMILPDASAMSAPLTSDTFCEMFCACDLSNRFSGETIDASVVLLSAEPLLMRILSVLDTNGDVDCALMQPSCKVALFTCAFRFAAVTAIPVK